MQSERSVITTELLAANLRNALREFPTMEARLRAVLEWTAGQLEAM